MANSTKTGRRKHLPLPQGPYPVGCVDVMTEHSDEGILMRLYYPATQEDVMDRTMQWPLWVPNRHYLDGYAQFMEIWPPFFKVMFKYCVGDVYVPAMWRAAPIWGMKFPVLVFSHGLGGCRTSYSTFCTEIASHGFIVAAVEHRDHSACYSYYLGEANNRMKHNVGESGDFCEPATTPVSHDGTPTIIPQPINFRHVWRPTKEYPVRNQQVHQRARECQKALDVLLAINRGDYFQNLADSNFHGVLFQDIMDVSRIGIAGHSFGGCTVIPTLASDPRFQCGLALDAWMFPILKDTELLQSAEKPLLFINSQKFQTASNLKRMVMLENKSPDAKILTIRGTTHHNQSDLPFITGGVLRRLVGASSVTNRFLAMDLSNRLALSFLWKHLDIPANPEYEAFLENNKELIVEGVALKSKI